MENGSPVAGGGGTSAVTYVSATQTIWAQDAGSGNWYSWDGTNWNGPSSTSPVPSGVSTSCGGGPSQTVLTPSCGGSITDASGNVWTLTSSGAVDENGSPVAGGGGTSALTYVPATQTIWGQDGGSGNWYSWNGGGWVGPSTTSPVPSNASTGCGSGSSSGGSSSSGSSSGGSSGSGSGSGGGTTSETRDPSHYPGADGRFWSLPLQKTANWITSGAEWNLLQKGTPQVRQDGFYSVNWVVGTSSDPDCTVTDGTQSFTIKVPAGTLAENAGDLGDDSLGGADSTRPYLGWSCNGTLIDGAPGNAVQPGGSTIDCSIGLYIFDTTGPVMEDATTGNRAYQSSDNAIGNLPDYELARALAEPTYVPPHTVTVTADTTQASPALAWPVVVSDIGSTGLIPEGSLIGIPFNVPKPSGLSRGGSLLWDIFQQFGGIIYNTGGAGAISLETYAQQMSTSALVADMNNSFPTIMQSMAILASDGSPGSQTSATTAKGMIGGARTDAFPAPPTLELIPSATHPQWYSTGLGNFFSSP